MSYGDEQAESRRLHSFLQEGEGPMADTAPRTEAGRALLGAVRQATLDPALAKMLGGDGEVLLALVSPDAIRDAILAIEAEARQPEVESDGH